MAPQPTTSAAANDTSAPETSETPPRVPAGETMVDVRGPRFAAAVTATVLVIALVVQGTVGIALVAVQVVVFAIATVRGVAHSPWAHLFRAVRRRAGWGPPTEVESATPPRFAQACGLFVAGVGLVALAAGAVTTGWVAVGIVLALATVLATSGLCVGCELWLLGQRLRRSRP